MKEIPPSLRSASASGMGNQIKSVHLSGNLKHYLTRLKRASLPEVAYRAGQALRVNRMRVPSLARKRFVEIPAVDSATTSRLQLPDFCLDINEAVIENIFNGGLFTLNDNQGECERFEGVSTNIFFADIRLGPSSPDIRMVWEPARLQHITALLLNTKENPVLVNSAASQVLARNSLLEWIRQNPFLVGPHYMSPMECGLRIPVFLYAMQVLENLSPDERREIIEAIYLHAWWVARNLSLYSSLGNHTICECVGLVFGGAIFGSFPEGQSWLSKSVKLLQQEINHQILHDGGPAEQSINYHRFVLDLYWLVVDFLESNRLYDCTAWKPRLMQGEAFLAAFRNEKGKLPSIGDSDDGHAVAPVVIPKRGIPDRKIEEFVTFHEAGYTVVRTRAGILMTFDHGPLGMKPLHNHGHADALSINLSLNGEWLLVDPGTYRYNGVPEWRRYFKGTRAHNTITIDGQDQAVQETGFIWSHPYSCRLTKNLKDDGGGRALEAEYDGYRRLREPVLHRRLIHLTESRIMIRDTFSGKGHHQYELNYHIHPDCRVSQYGQWFRVAGENGCLFMRIAGDDQFNLTCGQENPPFGWYSPAYNVRLKSPVLSCRREGTPNTVTFVTAICIGDRMSEEELESFARQL